MQKQEIKLFIALYKSVKEYVPADAGGKYKVFLNMFLSVSDPATYASTWLKLMKDIGVGCDGMRGCCGILRSNPLPYRLQSWLI